MKNGASTNNLAQFNEEVLEHENWSKVELQFQNFSDWGPKRDPLYIVIPFTIIFGAIFLTGLIGNISTCIVIARNKSMHTATNYYLFSLAISDLLLLISGLPQEMYYIWSKYPYIFGEAFCVLQGFASETSANATVLTITAFTVERYIAICHPFLSHTMSTLSRAIKFILIIWMVAICLAIPQAISFGIIYEKLSDGVSVNEDHNICNVKRVVIPHTFLISTLLFFVTPMSLITIFYILIGLQLRQSPRGPARGGSIKISSLVHKKVMITHKHSMHQTSFVTNNNTNTDCQLSPQEGSKNSCTIPTSQASTQHVVKMLVAVVVAFFICWAPFHAQRLLAIYAQPSSSNVIATFNALTYISGVLYYMSTTINPVLYHIMSNKFRMAFKETFFERLKRKQKPELQLRYSTLSGRSSIDKGTEANDVILFKSTNNERINHHIRHEKKIYRNRKGVYLNSSLINKSSKIKYVSPAPTRNNFTNNMVMTESLTNASDDESIIYANYNVNPLVTNLYSTECEIFRKKVSMNFSGLQVNQRCNSCRLINKYSSTDTYKLSKSVTMPNVKICYFKSSLVT
ncbi:hypothetical protein FQA39_LY10584 [Lamprigera yunnana]|nr:hypothetical protein FQA39_LY10584 [Lamprigera yunnana]